ncbi:hypothetical protein [Methylocystis sp. IM2]|uniref:hypothetical protein n=1 Tax=unclassified Methylocystis TaxID=2625913 RepID=UPI00404775AB
MTTLKILVIQAMDNLSAEHAEFLITKEAFMAKNGFVSRIHRKKPKDRPMLNTVRRANALKSIVHSLVEQVFAKQKDRMDLFIPTIGIARARIKIRMTDSRLELQTAGFLAKDRCPLTLRRDGAAIRGPARFSIACGSIGRRSTSASRFARFKWRRNEQNRKSFEARRPPGFPERSSLAGTMDDADPE